MKEPIYSLLSFGKNIENLGKALQNPDSTILDLATLAEHFGLQPIFRVEPVHNEECGEGCNETGN